MSVAGQIVAFLLENDEQIDPKAFVEKNHLYPIPKIRTTFSKIRWRDDAEGDPNGYDEEHGFEDEEGQDVEVDEFDREEGLDVADVAANWLRSEGVGEASSSHFHPGIWYSGYPEQDYHTGWETTRSFHLEGFTPEEEQEIFYRLFPKRRPRDPQMQLPL